VQDHTLNGLVICSERRRRAHFEGGLDKENTVVSVILYLAKNIGAICV